VAFSYRWPLVSFVSKPVAVRTTVHPVCLLLMAVRPDSSSSAWNPGKTRSVSRCYPNFSSPNFAAKEWKEDSSGSAWNPGIREVSRRSHSFSSLNFAADLPFFFSHHFRHQSHTSSVQRGSMQTGTADS
jgi:hypothetical protein